LLLPDPNVFSAFNYINKGKTQKQTKKLKSNLGEIMYRKEQNRKRKQNLSRPSKEVWSKEKQRSQQRVMEPGSKQNPWS